MEEVRSIPVTLSKVERLKLANQYRILEKLSDGHESKHYGNLADIFQFGYTYFYDLATEHFHEDIPEEIGQEVIDILDLHRTLLFSVQDLPEAERGDFVKKVEFEGFDGNNESAHLVLARFYCEKMGRHNELKVVNSHCTTLDRYRAQLKAWNQLGKKHRLSKVQIEELLAAKRYWEK
ncbi:MAG: YfbU family protein [Candidatus Obscuribacterales bacterium]|nr:YfbU family protein [Candidatus Obscuribacterales bacterium]